MVGTGDHHAADSGRTKMTAVLLQLSGTKRNRVVFISSGLGARANGAGQVDRHRAGFEQDIACGSKLWKCRRAKTLGWEERKTAAALERLEHDYVDHGERAMPGGG